MFDVMITHAIPPSFGFTKGGSLSTFGSNVTYLKLRQPSPTMTRRESALFLRGAEMRLP